MEKISTEQAIEAIIEKDPRYPREAYEFVRESLDCTIRLFRKDAVGKERHVTGKELLEGMRRHALDQFGPLAHTVLTSWNLRTGEDGGEIVFNMVNARVLSKTDRDKREDFQNGYDFEEAFKRPFEPPPRTSAQPTPQSTKPRSVQST